MKKALILLCAVLSAASLAGCRNHAVPALGKLASGGEESAPPETISDPSRAETPGAETADEDADGDRKFDDSYYTDLTEIEKSYADLNASLKEMSISNADYGNSVSSLADRLKQMAGADYDKIQATLDSLFAAQYTGPDIHDYFKADEEKKKVSDFWTGELNSLDQEETLQDSVIELTYTGGSIGGLLKPEAEYKLNSDMAYRMRNLRIHYDEIRNIWIQFEADDSAAPAS